MQLLRQIDGKEIGNALNASAYSIELVEKYLREYKFKEWKTHSNGNPVSQEDKNKRAGEIANLLCNHSVWKTHSRGISRDIAWNVCKLKITEPESIVGLHKELRRFWALIYFVFENTPVYKIFSSSSYHVFRQDISLINRGV